MAYTSVCDTLQSHLCLLPSLNTMDPGPTMGLPVFDASYTCEHLPAFAPGLTNCILHIDLRPQPVWTAIT